MRLTGINIHPVKSTAIRPVEQAYVGRTGLVGDREWMVVDTEGELVTARELPELFRVVADVPATGGSVDLLLRGPGLDPLEVAVPGDDAEALDVRLFATPLTARAAGDAADAWLRKSLGRDDLRLVWCTDPTRRALTEPGLGPDDHAAFQDDSPVSLLSHASVAQVSAWTEEPMVAERFRANLLVDRVAEAFAEEGWSEVAIGGARFRVACPISRCSMTTIDPETLTTGKDPLRALARHRKSGPGPVHTAVHLAVAHPGEIAVGDEVVVS
ncbi:MAG: MOSC domain-containing protein [Nocardioides sp.]|nr:MOSC domain-containing protein [Nocardioides sp.]